MQIKIKNTKLFLAAIFVLCTGSQLFSYGGNTAIAPLLTAIGGYEFYSLVAPLGATGMMVALPAVAALGRKIGSKTVLFLGAFLMLFGRVGMQFANSVFTIGLFNFLGSFGSGFVITAPFVMIGTAFERSASIKYYGYIATFNAIGSLIGPPLAGMLVDVNLPRISFLLWIPLYVFSLIAIGMLYPNSKSQSKEKFDVTGWLYLAIMVFAFVMWTGLSGKVFPWLSFGLLLQSRWRCSRGFLCAIPDALQTPLCRFACSSISASVRHSSAIAVWLFSPPAHRDICSITCCTS